MKLTLKPIVVKLTTSETLIGYGVFCEDRNEVPKAISKMFDQILHVVYPAIVDRYLDNLEPYLLYSDEAVLRLPAENCMLIVSADEAGCVAYQQYLDEQEITSELITEMLNLEMIQHYSPEDFVKHVIH